MAAATAKQIVDAAVPPSASEDSSLSELVAYAKIVLRSIPQHYEEGKGMSFDGSWLSYRMFGSMEEGRKHMYFDFYRLRGLPGTVEKIKPDGLIACLNQA
ncbi:hypothetical protein AB1Y20_011793 [Prymnesium parvum]|uniref:Uncharacterized protein n=1 Tax=Prymnesium parvum TaxID=97485 RepID=A0AB34IHJ5_PRYPA